MRRAMYPAHGQTYASTHTRCHTTSNDDLRTFMTACLTRVSSMTKSNGSVRSTHDKRTTHAYLPQALQIPRARFAAVALVLSPCPAQAMSQSVALRLVATFLEARRRRRRQEHRRVCDFPPQVPFALHVQLASVARRQILACLLHRSRVFGCQLLFSS